MTDFIFDLQMFTTYTIELSGTETTNTQFKLDEEKWVASNLVGANESYIKWTAEGFEYYEYDSDASEYKTAVVLNDGSANINVTSGYTNSTAIPLLKGTLTAVVSANVDVGFGAENVVTCNGVAVGNTSTDTKVTVALADEDGEGTGAGIVPVIIGTATATLETNEKALFGMGDNQELITNTGSTSITVTKDGISVPAASTSNVSFTIGAWTYAFDGAGKLTVTAGPEAKEADKEKAGDYTYTTSGEAIVITPAGTKAGIDTLKQGESTLVKSSTSSDAGIGIKVAKNTTGTDLLAVTGTVEGQNKYVHIADGKATITSSSKDALGTLSKNKDGEYTYTISNGNTSVQITDANKWTIVGSSGDDYIVGSSLTGSATSVLNGGKGNDTILAGLADVVSGGDGNDSLSATVAGSTASLNGGNGDDVLFSTIANVTMTGGKGADTFVLYGDAAGKGFISDKDYSISDDVIAAGAKLGDMKTAATDTTEGGTAGRRAMFGVDGKLATGTGEDAGVLYFAESSVYAANVTGSDKTSQIFGWVGEKAATLDGSKLTKSAILMGDTNDEGDLLLGGSGDDVVFAGSGDSVAAGAGKNEIHLLAGDPQTVSVGSGKDNITGFTTGFDAEKADKLLVSGFDLTGISSGFAGTSNADLTIKGGSAAVTLAGANSDGIAKVLVGDKKAVFLDTGAEVSVDSKTFADYYIGSKNGSAINASGIEETLKIDLTDTKVYKNITTVTGGASTTSIIGGKANESLKAGAGRTSIYGGAGKDTLVSNTDESVTFFMTAEAGSDLIQDFKFYTADTADKADVINLSAVQSAKLVTGGVQINVDDSNKVLISGADADKAIKYQSGNSVGIAKIGAASDTNDFTYDAAVNYYGGGNKVDTIVFDSGDADNHQIWLDGSKGVTYASIDVIDGSKAEGDLILAGDSAKNTISAGSGNASLWGGAGNSADSLAGGSSTNVFFYGVGEGNDVIEVNSDDNTVNLYNVTLNDLKISGQEITGSGVVLEFNNGEKLTVNTGARDVKFALKDGNTYTAHQDTQSWT